MHKTWRFAAAAIVMLLVFPARASAAIRIHKIRYDPPGADYTSNKQLRSE
jgi:P pilus assembly chaperone PapD